MDADFDFLRYLDFGNVPGVVSGEGQVSNDILHGLNSVSGAGSASSSSAYTSPLDKPLSDWSASSPSASSQVSYGKSPAFGTQGFSALPQASLFDTSAFTWHLGDNSSVSTGTDSHTGNSPPFDTTSILPASAYWPAGSDQTMGGMPPHLQNQPAAPWPNQHQNQNQQHQVYNTNNNNTNNSLDYGSFQSNHISPSQPGNPTLAQQWQTLMAQQAQLQMQIALQTSTAHSMPSQSHDSTSSLVQPYGSNGQQFATAPTMSQHTANHPYQRYDSNPKTQQINQLPTTHQQSYMPVSTTSQHQQASSTSTSQRQPVNISAPLPVQTFPPVNNQHASQQSAGTLGSTPPSMAASVPVVPSVFAPIPSDTHSLLPQSSHETAHAPNIRPISKLPGIKTPSDKVMSVNPSGAVYHVSSVRSGAPVKTGIKRSYQQLKQEDVTDGGLGSANNSENMSRSASLVSQDSNEDSADAASKDDKKTAGGHNAVEQKYRRGINDSLITLREIVPALQHLRPVPGSEAAKRKQSQFSLAASMTPAAPSRFVDGVPAPNKLSKQLILVTATDYIRFLQNRRQELEGELQTFKQAMHDCVEDPQVVFRLAEERWAPTRATLLRARDAIHDSRIADKEQSKKQAKMERQKNASARRSSKPNVSLTGEALDSGSDDDEDDNGDDDQEDLDDSGMQATHSADTSIMRARHDGHKARPASKMQKTNKTGSRAAPTPQNHRALLSVFAGVSFAGGAGYDLIFGSPASGSATETVSPSQVWSRGNILKRDVLISERTATLGLSPLQAFFVNRPALLSGLVAMTLVTLGVYLLFAAIPNLAGAPANQTPEDKRKSARVVLATKAKDSNSVTLAAEREATATLAGVPQTTLGQARLLSHAFASFFVTVLAGASKIPPMDASVLLPTQARLAEEQAAAAIALVQNAHGLQSYGRRVADFLNLYHVYASRKWPRSRQTSTLALRAEAVLAIAALQIFGRRAATYAAARWDNAQSLCKKEDTQHTWLSLALSSDFDAVKEVCHECVDCGSALLELAERRAQASLQMAWSQLFADVVAHTATKDAISRIPLSASSCDSLVNQVLSCMPWQSPSYGLGLVYQGIQALAVNNNTAAIKVALQLSRHHVTRLASARAFVCLVSASATPEGTAHFTSNVDTLAHATVAWLAMRHQARELNMLTAKKDNAKAVSMASSSMQAKSVLLRKLLANEAFMALSDGHLQTAQEQCIEEVENMMREAAGLDSISDSGCEL